MSLALNAQLLFSGVSVGSVYALVALGLVMPFKAAGIVNFAQGELVMVGAYIALFLSVGLHLPFHLVVPITMALAAGFGIAIERAFIRPVMRAPEFTIVVATLAVGLMLKNGVRLIWQDNLYPLAVPFSTDVLALGPVRINPLLLYMDGTAIVLMALLALFFRFTRQGKAMRAVAQNPEGARLMGIRVSWVFSATWALSTAMAATAGMLLGALFGIHPEMGHVLIKAFVAAVVGGFVSLPGAVLGGVLVGVAETFSGAYVGSTFKDVVAFLLLIGVLLLRPHGLLGTPLARRV
ncbi:MAG TPA: branched-chain amino acid ABC transporter permease [candidate division Zixibacteria bacterium]|nr:branched-chain amino acid ABC transporter permease [candidate division Zixibacteria bacterium]